MLGLLAAGSALLGSGGGGSPLNAAVPEGPQTSSATSTTTVTQSTGGFNVGSGSDPTMTYILLAVGAYLLWRAT